MEQKTPMQELIEWCVLNSFNAELKNGTKMITIDFEEFRNQFNYYLKKEKQAIVDAVNETSEKDVIIGNNLLQMMKKKPVFMHDDNTGEQYFNDKYESTCQN